MPKIKYTDMCIYIDNYSLNKEGTEETVYNYLCEICLMLANKSKYFSKEADYELFSFFAASYYLLRLTNNYIKNILDYIKKSLYFVKCKFLISDLLETDNFVEPNIKVFSLDNDAYEASKYIDKSIFKLDLCYFDSYIKEYIEDNCLYIDKNTQYNLYMSSLFSIAHMLSLSEKQKCDFSDTNNIIKYLDKIDNKDLKLYHLDDSFTNYFKVFFKRLIRYLLDNLLGELDLVDIYTQQITLENEHCRKD